MAVTRRTDVGRALTHKEQDDNYSAAEAATTAVLTLQPAITTLAAMTSVGTAVVTAADQAAGRAALGLGSAATQEAGDFAIAGHLHTANQIADLIEAVQDIVGGFFGAGTGASVTYNDAANTITISATGTSDPEAIRDAIGAAVIGVGNISVVVNDVGDTIAISTTATSNRTDAATDTLLAAKADLSGAAFTGRVSIAPVVLTDAAPTVLNAALSNYYRWTMGGNRALSLTNVVAGQTYTVEIKQDATGSRTITWPSGFTWPGKTPGVLSTAANSIDVLTFITMDGTNYRAVLNKDFG